MSKAKKAWFILEVETGLIDGWYYGETLFERKEILRHWNEARPGYAHIVAEVVSGSAYLPDDRCLNRESL